MTGGLVSLLGASCKLRSLLAAEGKNSGDNLRGGGEGRTLR